MSERAELVSRGQAAYDRRDWPEAFRQAFGRSQDAFYRGFETYQRTDLGPPG